mgnify:CR=1 FL=1
MSIACAFRLRGKIILLAAFTSSTFAAELEIRAAVDKPRVKIGEEIIFSVEVANREQAATPGREIKFGGGSLDFEITMGQGRRQGEAVKFRYTRILGSPTEPERPRSVEIPGGGKLSGSARIPALLPGRMTIVGVLWGKIQLETIALEVEDDGRELFWKIETDQGTLQAKLLPEAAPNTVANLVLMARDGFYRQGDFHRIVKGFMIQGGCPKGDGTGGPGFCLPAEFSKTLKHVRGILSMARSSHKDSAGSQFFIVDGPAPWLDGQYTIFGELATGKEVLEKLTAAPVRPNIQGEASEPLQKPVIKDISVEVEAASQ